MRQVLARESDQLLLRELVPVFQGHKGTGDLPPLLVGLGHHLFFCGFGVWLGVCVFLGVSVGARDATLSVTAGATDASLTQIRTTKGMKGV